VKSACAIVQSRQFQIRSAQATSHYSQFAAQVVGRRHGAHGARTVLPLRASGEPGTPPGKAVTPGLAIRPPEAAPFPEHPPILAEVLSASRSGIGIGDPGSGIRDQDFTRAGRFEGAPTWLPMRHCATSNASTQTHEPLELALRVPVASMIRLCVPGASPPMLYSMARAWAGER
jgi:hypothetical protein